MFDLQNCRIFNFTDVQNQQIHRFAELHIHQFTISLIVCSFARMCSIDYNNIIFLIE